MNVRQRGGHAVDLGTSPLGDTTQIKGMTETETMMIPAIETKV